MFLVNSCHPLFTATSFEASILPKLLDEFAEFLQSGYLIRLRVLHVFTCVGLRYGVLFFERLEGTFPGDFFKIFPIQYGRKKKGSSRHHLLNSINGTRVRPSKAPILSASTTGSQKPLNFRRSRFTRDLSLLMSAFSLLIKNFIIFRQEYHIQDAPLPLFPGGKKMLVRCES